MRWKSRVALVDIRAVSSAPKALTQTCQPCHIMHRSFGSSRYCMKMICESNG
jgi:hypothetical protein